MADGTKIEWTDATWNPVTGCRVVSPGCTNCYAMRLAGTRLKDHPSRAGLTQPGKAGPVWTGEVRFNEGVLDQPLRWRRPRRIFVCAHGDLFAEGVPAGWIDRVFAVMALSPQHTFQVLTKRVARMRDYLASETLAIRIEDAAYAVAHERGHDGGEAQTRAFHALLDGPLPNVWLGVSVEDQVRADERVPILLDTPAAVRWVSAEPLLGPVDLRAVWTHCPVHDFHSGFCVGPCPDRRRLDWVVAGGESGPGARPMNPNWARSLRDQCVAAGVPFFFKQWGAFRPLATAERGQACGATLIGNDRHDRDAWVLHVGKARAGRMLDGRTWDQYPGAA